MHGAPEGADLGRSIEGSSEHGGPAYARRTFADPAGDFAFDGLEQVSEQNLFLLKVHIGEKPWSGSSLGFLP